MAYVRTVAPTEIPVSVDDAKAHLRVTTDDENSYIGDRIRDAVDWIERFDDRQVCTATWALYLDAFPGSTGGIEIAKYPVQSIASITYTDMAGASQTLASTVYELDAASRPVRLAPAYNQIWPQTLQKLNNVAVTFVAGYGLPTDVPPSIKSAILKFAAHLYEFREGDGKPPADVSQMLSATGARGPWGYG